MAAVKRKALTLQHGDLSKLPDLYDMVLSGLRMPRVPSEVLLLFAERLEVRECGCWHWSGERPKHKYARFQPGAAWATSVNSLGHRFSVAIFTGLRVPNNMVVDHLCADRSCVAPHHLEVITFEENVKRGSYRSHANKTCSPSYCPPSKVLSSTAKPGDDYMEKTLKAFVKLKALLKTPLEDERKLFAFAAHVNILGPIPKVQRGAVGNCWLWEGALTDGYGKMTTKQVKGETRSAHRWSYLNFIGDIEEGLMLDHTCEVRNCVRPSHLQAVTSAVNSSFSLKGVSAVNARKTHCKYGHEYTPENTQVTITPTGSHRTCITCNKRRGAESYASKKAGTQKFKRTEGFCLNGHERTEENTRITATGGRVCRICVAASARTLLERRAAAGENYKHPRK